jgi:hypothetical protein
VTTAVLWGAPRIQRSWFGDHHQQVVTLSLEHADGWSARSSMAWLRQSRTLKPHRMLTGHPPASPAPPQQLGDSQHRRGAHRGVQRHHHPTLHDAVHQIRLLPENDRPATALGILTGESARAMASSLRHQNSASCVCSCGLYPACCHRCSRGPLSAPRPRGGRRGRRRLVRPFCGRQPRRRASCLRRARHSDARAALRNAPP